MLQLDDPTTSCLSTKHLYATWSNFIRFSRFERFASYHQFLLPISLGMLDLLRICYMVCNVTNDTYFPSLTLSLSISLFWVRLNAESRDSFHADTSQLNHFESICGLECASRPLDTAHCKYQLPQRQNGNWITISYQSMCFFFIQYLIFV